MPFLNEMIATPLRKEEHGSGYWRLQEPLLYHDGVKTLVIPAGFETDLASIPRFARSFMPRDASLTRPAVLHDWLLINPDRKRSEIHDLFGRALREEGLDPVRRWMVVRAVKTADALGLLDD